MVHQQPNSPDSPRVIQQEYDFSKANTSTKASFSGVKPVLADKHKTTASAAEQAAESVRPAPSAEEVAKFEQMIRKSSCRKTSIIFSMEWLGVKVKSACMLRGLNDLLHLADEHSEGSAANLSHTKVLVSNCTKMLTNLYSQAHAKMAVETDPAKKQLIELGMDEKVGLIRFHVSISQFRQSFNSLTNLAVRLCQKKGKALYSEVMTVSRINVITVEQEVIYKIGPQTGEQMQRSNKPPVSTIVEEDSGDSGSQKVEGPQTKVYKKDGHKDGKLVQSFEGAVEEQRNGFYSTSGSNVKNGEKKTLLWEAKYPHAPGLDIVIYFLVIKEISPILFWSMKREISSKQLNDIERYGQMIKIYLLPQDEKLKASRVFDFTTGKQIDDELIGMELTPAVPQKSVSKEPALSVARPPKEQSALAVPAPSQPVLTEIKLSSDPVDELVFQRRDMILQNPFCLSQLQPRQILILIEQVIDRNHTIRYLNLGETFRRADYYRQQVSVRAVINACGKITLHHLKKIHGIEFRVLRLKLAEEHYSSRMFFDAKAIPGRQPETLNLEYPDYDGLIFSESIHLLQLVFKEQLDYLNVKEYVGRLKTSFDKPFMLTASISAPMASAQKETVRPRAPPAPVIAPPVASKTKSLLEDLDEYPVAAKPIVKPEISSAGKGQQPKHLQAGSQVLQRLAMLASVSRAAPKDESDSGRESVEKKQRAHTGEGSQPERRQPPLKPALASQAVTHLAISSSGECTDVSDGELPPLGKRKRPDTREHKAPQEASRRENLTIHQSQGHIGRTDTASIHKQSGRVRETMGSKVAHSSQVSEKILPDSRPHNDNNPLKAKKKIKITKEDLQTLQALSATIDKPRNNQNRDADSKVSSQEPSSAKKQLRSSETKQLTSEGFDPKRASTSSIRVDNDPSTKTRGARGGRDPTARNFTPESQGSSTRNPPNQMKSKQVTANQHQKAPEPQAGDARSTSKPKTSTQQVVRTPAPKPAAQRSREKNSKTKQPNKANNNRSTAGKPSQPVASSHSKPADDQSDSSGSLSIQSLPSHDFDTSSAGSESSEEEVLPQQKVPSKKKKAVRVSPVARKTPTRITCLPGEQVVEAVEVITYGSESTNQEQSNPTKTESAESSSQASESKEDRASQALSSSYMEQFNAANSPKEDTSNSDMVIVLGEEEGSALTGRKPAEHVSEESLSEKRRYRNPEGSTKTEPQPQFMARLADLHKRMAGKKDESDRTSQPRQQDQSSYSISKVRNRKAFEDRKSEDSSSSNSRASEKSVGEYAPPIRDQSMNYSLMLNKRKPDPQYEQERRDKHSRRPYEPRVDRMENKKEGYQYSSNHRDSRERFNTSQHHAYDYPSQQSKRPYAGAAAAQSSSSTRFVQQRYPSNSRAPINPRDKQGAVQSMRRCSPVGRFETISSRSGETSDEQTRRKDYQRRDKVQNYARGPRQHERRAEIPTYGARTHRPNSVLRQQPYR